MVLGLGIWNKPRLGPVGAVAADAVAGVRGHEPQFNAPGHRDSDRLRRVVLVHYAAVEDLLVVDKHLKHHAAGTLAPLPLDARLALERLISSVQRHDDFAVCMMAQAALIALVLDAQVCGHSAERHGFRIPSQLAPVLG